MSLDLNLSKPQTKPSGETIKGLLRKDFLDIEAEFNALLGANALELFCAKLHTDNIITSQGAINLLGLLKANNTNLATSIGAGATANLETLGLQAFELFNNSGALWKIDKDKGVDGLLTDSHDKLVELPMKSDGDGKHAGVATYTQANALGIISRIAPEAGLIKFDVNPDEGAYTLHRGQVFRQFNGASSNLVTNSFDLTSGWIVLSGTGTKLLDAVGIDGSVNSATTLVDTGIAYLYRLLKIITIAADTASYTPRIEIMKTAAPNVANIGFNMGGITSFCIFNTATGELSTDTLSNVVVEDWGDRFSIQLQTLVNNGTKTSIAISVYPSIRSSLNGSNDVGATGDLVIGNIQLEPLPFSTPTIKTGASVVSRLSTNAVAIQLDGNFSIGDLCIRQAFFSLGFDTLPQVIYTTYNGVSTVGMTRLQLEGTDLKAWLHGYNIGVVATGITYDDIHNTLLTYNATTRAWQFMLDNQHLTSGVLAGFPIRNVSTQFYSGNNGAGSAALEGGLGLGSISSVLPKILSA